MLLYVLGYLLLGFIITCIMLYFDPQDEEKLLQIGYYAIIFWPLFLPLYTLLYINKLSIERKKKL